MTTLTYSTVLTMLQCGVCGIPHAIPEDMHKRNQETGQSWYCPNGHKIGYRESDNKRLQRQLDSAEARAVHAEDQAQAAEYRRRAAAGQLTKIKRRVAAGVCPCCKRTFQNLGDHMTGQHPEYVQ